MTMNVIRVKLLITVVPIIIGYQLPENDYAFFSRRWWLKIFNCNFTEYSLI